MKKKPSVIGPPHNRAKHVWQMPSRQETPQDTVSLVPPDHPALRQRAAEVQTITGIHRRTIDNMFTALSQYGHGVGLAAPQIGVSSRIIVFWINRTQLALINPVLSSFSEEHSVMSEGCLTMPGILVPISRPISCTIEGRLRDNRPFGARLEGLWAKVAQHECDHLDGIMITDYLPKESANDAVRQPGVP